MANGRLEHDAAIEASIQKYLNVDYMIEYAATFGTKTASTKKQYIINISNFVKYLNENGIKITSGKDFEVIVPSKIYVYLNLWNGKTKKIQIYYALKSFFDFLKANRYITYNIMLDVNPPKQTANVDVVAMSKDEVACVKSEIESSESSFVKRDIAIFQIGVSTGMRISSIIEMNVEDIDFENMCVTIVEKGNKERVIPLGKNTIAILKEWLAERKAYLLKRGRDSKAVFISNRCTRITTQSCERNIKKYAVSLKKKITPHKMRSTCATHLYEKTSDIYLVMEQLGHKNIKNTMRYARVSDERRRAASNILDDFV